jgi:hypothetical protein
MARCCPVGALPAPWICAEARPQHPHAIIPAAQQTRSNLMPPESRTAHAMRKELDEELLTLSILNSTESQLILFAEGVDAGRAIPHFGTPSKISRRHPEP